MGILVVVVVGQDLLTLRAAALLLHYATKQLFIIIIPGR